MALILTGSRPDRHLKGKRIVTERQECVLNNFTHVTEEVFPLTVSVDVPVAGSQRVIDSITVFLNESLYAFFDDGHECHIPYSLVYSEDIRQLASHYRKAYMGSYLPKQTDMHEFNSDCLEVYLVAQTDAYVTYEVNHMFFGEGLEVLTEWTTFAKSDGHRLKEVIGEPDLQWFYLDHPGYKNSAVGEHVWRSLDTGTSFDFSGSVGLLADTVAYQHIFAPGIFEIDKFPLDEIVPYLSQEARDLSRKP